MNLVENMIGVLIISALLWGLWLRKRPNRKYALVALTVYTFSAMMSIVMSDKASKNSNDPDLNKKYTDSSNLFGVVSFLGLVASVYFGFKNDKFSYNSSNGSDESYQKANASFGFY